jgi:pilus assembly protein CpaC
MSTSMLIRSTLLIVAIAACSFAGMRETAAADANVPLVQFTGSDATSRFVPLGIGKSVVIDLPRDVKDVLVTSRLSPASYDRDQ